MGNFTKAVAISSCMSIGFSALNMLGSKRKRSVTVPTVIAEEQPVVDTEAQPSATPEAQPLSQEEIDRILTDLHAAGTNPDNAVLADLDNSMVLWIEVIEDYPELAKWLASTKEWRWPRILGTPRFAVSHTLPGRKVRKEDVYWGRDGVIYLKGSGMPIGMDITADDTMTALRRVELVRLIAQWNANHPDNKVWWRKRRLTGPPTPLTTEQGSHDVEAA